jgi:hypothetical protein
VLPAVVREFGGWEDYQTFAEHYMGEITPEAQQRERSKIDYVGGDPEQDTMPFSPRTSGAKRVYQG